MKKFLFFNIPIVVLMVMATSPKWSAAICLLVANLIGYEEGRQQK